MFSYKIGGNLSQTVAVVATLSIVSVALVHWYNAQKKKRVPTKWKTVGKVVNVFMYPLKSGRRVSLQTAECNILGLKQIKEPGKYQLGDRTLVVYKDSSKECRTARANPKMILIEVSVDDEDYLVLNAPEMTTLRLEIAKILDETRNDKREEFVSFFIEEKFHVVDCGEEAAQWLTKYLSEDGFSESRLGLHDGKYRRGNNKIFNALEKAYPKISVSSLGVYSDLTSFMMINQASIDELIKRVPNYDITVNNFRPNFVVSDNTLLAFEEDKWEWIKIGDVVFRNVKACTRCIMTTINPETGTRNKNLEPLKTLRTFRLVSDLIKTDMEKNSPVMGIHLGLIQGGVINVGDDVSVSL